MTCVSNSNRRSIRRRRERGKSVYIRKKRQHRAWSVCEATWFVCCGGCCEMNFTAGFITLFSIFTTSAGLECYRCSSNDTLDCLEKFMHPNPLRAESCADVLEARYCIKTTGIYNGVIGTRRFCHDSDLGNLCEFIPHEGREYKGCVYTCNTDGCNAATTNYQVPFLRYLCVLMSIVLFMRKLL